MEELTFVAGEPDKRYFVNYVIIDSTRDGIPELHIFTQHGEYYVFSYGADGMYLLESIFSGSGTSHYVLEDGALIHRNQYIG